MGSGGACVHQLEWMCCPVTGGGRRLPGAQGAVQRVFTVLAVGELLVLCRGAWGQQCSHEGRVRRMSAVVSLGLRGLEGMEEGGKRKELRSAGQN